jgi:hypothetical protein
MILDKKSPLNVEKKMIFFSLALLICVEMNVINISVTNMEYALGKRFTLNTFMAMTFVKNGLCEH